jgi:hypothetical protein
MRRLTLALIVAAVAFGCVPAAGGGRLSCDRTGTACTLEARP